MNQLRLINSTTIPPVIAGRLFYVPQVENKQLLTKTTEGEEDEGFLEKWEMGCRRLWSKLWIKVSALASQTQCYVNQTENLQHHMEINAVKYLDDCFKKKKSIFTRYVCVLHRGVSQITRFFFFLSFFSDHSKNTWFQSLGNTGGSLYLTMAITVFLL